MPPLRGIQNAGPRDPLPLQRKCVHTRCLFGLSSCGRALARPVFLHGQLYWALLTHPCSLRNQPVPSGSPNAQRAVRSAAGRLGESPGCPLFVPFWGVSWFVHDSHPSTSRRSTAEGKRLSQFSRCRLHWETCLHGNRRVTSPNSIHRSIFFFLMWSEHQLCQQSQHAFCLFLFDVMALSPE